MALNELEDTRVKGAVVLNFLEAARESLGAATVDAAVGELEPDDRREIAEALAVSQVRIRSCEALLYKLAEKSGRDVYELNKSLNRVATERTMNTVWRLVLKLATVEMMLKRARSVFKQAYDKGDLVVDGHKPGEATLTMSGRRNISRLGREAFAEGMEAIFRLRGLKDVRSEFKARPDGLTLTLRWTP